MTERVNRRSSEAVEERPVFSDDFAPHRNVTADIVDRAVEETFKEAQVTPEVARVMRSLMAGDSSSAVAKAYYHGVASGTPGVSTIGVKRRELEVSYVLTDAQVNMLSEYAPDFSLRYSNRDLHDHPMAAASRSVDRAVIEARLPPVARVSHIGGSVIPLVVSGKLGHGHHACMPIVDRKDPARHVLLNLQVRKIAADAKRSLGVREAAAGYLARSVDHVCGDVVQKCTYQSSVLTSVHVYDIPMSDWPAIMDSKGARLVEGCLLFPRDIFSRSAGELSVAGARYEVDANANVFRMGFVDSPSWWYEHGLSEFLKYGVDQVLSRGGATYAYKIIERRGDTIFFRILRVSPTTLPEFVQHYRVPGVQMVRVNGFPVDAPKQNPLRWARKTYLFPAPLWEDMLGHAKEMIERGTLTQEKMFGYYRTVAPRQSINAVVVAGGATVDDLNHLVPLVLHVVLFAMLEVRKTAAEALAVTGAVMREREREGEWTMYKVVAAFGGAVLGAFKLSCIPITVMLGLVDKGVSALAELNAYDWDLSPVVQQVSAKLVLPSCFSAVPDSAVVAGFSEEYRLAAPRSVLEASRANPETAAFVLGAFSSVLPQSTRDSLREAAAAKVVKVEEGTDPGAEGSTTLRSLGAQDELSESEVSEQEVERRRASIREAVIECESEAAKSEAACADQFRELLVSGRPYRKKLESRKEMFGNPEFWMVTAGVVESSFSGAPVEGFQHSAVYVPVPQDGQRLISIVEDEFKGMSRGEYVERTYYRLSSGSYTGWVYTNDSLMVYNGPAIAAALTQALDKPLGFRVTLFRGPPGCGKTTQIVEAARPGDVVLVPVRKAARETSARLAERGGEYTSMARDRTRTVDSYLVNRDRRRVLREMSADRLLADEAFMTREGRWLAAAAHLGVSVVQAYGDPKQIPHVPRAECPKTSVSLRHQTEVASWVTYRCPPELVACWGGVYNWRVRSLSKVKGLVRHVLSSAGLDVPDGCVMMGMYQADKKILREKYASCGKRIQVMTVHESEGNTYKDVWLHRFDVRKRNDSFSLYDKEPYALVAMSRSTRSFVYVGPRLGDVVSTWVERGKDPRRVAAASDASSAGESVEKL